MQSLADIAARHAAEGADPGHGDKGTVHSYIPHYERLLAPYRESGHLLEIGLALGKSIDMWDEWMGPAARICGVDLSIVFWPKPPRYARHPSRITLVQADATKPEFLREIGNFRTFDVIIDDGSHMQADQEASFRLLAPRVRPGGLYIIEDVLNLEASRDALTALHPNCEVIDLRAVKGRFDDVLVVFRF